MKAILVDQNMNLVWSDVPFPTAKQDEVILKICAAALNRADLLQRQGKYPSPPGCPEWMGLEVAGVITHIGNEAETKSGWKVGDQACALLGGGGYAEAVAVRYDMLMPIPKGLTLEEASSLPEAFATSYLNLVIEGGLKSGDTAYIPAGASGLASAAIPLAKSLGAKVVTSVLSDEMANSIIHLGADVVINSRKQNIVEYFENQHTLGNSINVAMDCLGGESLGQILPFMANGGRWILISTLDGTTTQINLRPLLTKGVRLAGSMLRNRTPEMKAQILKELTQKIWGKIEQGVIKPSIYKILPIQQAEEAHAILERGENSGKVVLKVC